MDKLNNAISLVRLIHAKHGQGRIVAIAIGPSYGYVTSEVSTTGNGSTRQIRNRFTYTSTTINYLGIDHDNNQDNATS